MSKTIALVLLLNFLCLLLPATNAATFNVGDAGGWGFGVSSWPNGKSFKAGAHTVVAVSEPNFNACNPSGTTFTSGNDQITLARGKNFFICGIPGHCSSFGMKIAITAN
ncbi:hypothetical protein M9H77_20829 [Catharanthus roseus]|uniref:Uncharacterized protein n=1 Tax=Catharanthus roseus TaxID=4058 RepID=A0ACC0ALN8_CATRO|nr:hypothetical protein M9H77_20829 [Catharanthus roseus]